MVFQRSSETDETLILISVILKYRMCSGTALFPSKGPSMDHCSEWYGLMRRMLMRSVTVGVICKVTVPLA
jgi:hypothetical protein